MSMDTKTLHKVMDDTTGTLRFPPEWRSDPDSDWLKHVDPELRAKGGAPSELMASALKRMPADHPQREEVDRVYNQIQDLQKKKLEDAQAKQAKKGQVAAQQACMTLTLQHLKANPEHNGKQVYLEEWVVDRERWRCRLPSGEIIGVRPRNLF